MTPRTAQDQLAEAADGLRASGRLETVPRALLSSAVFRRSIGDWGGSAHDLDEVEEIASPGPMPIFLCDTATERARLAFARIEAFAPLNGFVDGSPSDEARIILGCLVEQRRRVVNENCLANRLRGQTQLAGTAIFWTVRW